MNTQVPVINVSELGEYAEFIIDALVVRNRMSLRITSEDGDALIVPVIEKSPIPPDVLADLEEMQKAIEAPDIGLAGPPPLDMPF